MINIGGDKADASYRYKMPKLVTKVEGRGNGIKTVIVNMLDVAKALHTDPAYTTKFFGNELGAQSKWSPATEKAAERSVVNGQHQAKDLQEQLEKFISTFILCPACGLPEIKMKVKKGDIEVDCHACGHNGNLKTSNKLAGYIVKKHKEDKKKKKEAKEGKTKKDKKDKKGKKKEKKEKEEEAAEAEKEKKEKKKKSKDEDEAEVEWFTDTSKAAMEERKKLEFASMAGGDLATEKAKQIERIMADGEGGERKMTDPIVMLKLFIVENKDPDLICSELRRLQMARGLDEPQKLKLLLEAVIDFTNPATVPAQYTKNAKLLKKFTKGRQNSLVFLGCIEEQVGMLHPELLKRVALILQALYEADVLEEEHLVAWHEAPAESSWLTNKKVATQVRKNATELIKWLQEADEESSEEA